MYQVTRIHKVLGAPTPEIIQKFRSKGTSHISLDFPPQKVYFYICIYIYIYLYIYIYIYILSIQINIYIYIDINRHRCIYFI
jgi:hypothetical protein